MFDSKSKSAVNKLIVLYILDKMDFPITNSQLTNIILENNVINYFSLQECISELESSDLIKVEENKQKITYQISTNGKRTLEMFKDKIPGNVRSTVDKYIDSHKEQIKKDSEIFADFTKVNDHEYIVNLKVVENEIVLIDLKLNVVSAKQAKQMCEKWKSSSGIIYGHIMDTLIK